MHNCIIGLFHSWLYCYRLIVQKITLIKWIKLGESLYFLCSSSAQGYIDQTYDGGTYLASVFLIFVLI